MLCIIRRLKMAILNIILGVFVQFLSNPTILIALIVLVGLLMQKKNKADCIRCSGILPGDW